MYYFLNIKSVLINTSGFMKISGCYMAIPLRGWIYSLSLLPNGTYSVFKQVDTVSVVKR